MNYSSGAGDLLEGMAKLPGLTQSIQTSLLNQAPDKAKPLWGICDGHESLSSYLMRITCNNCSGGTTCGAQMSDKLF